MDGSGHSNDELKHLYLQTKVLGKKNGDDHYVLSDERSLNVLPLLKATETIVVYDCSMCVRYTREIVNNFWDWRKKSELKNGFQFFF